MMLLALTLQAASSPIPIPPDEFRRQAEVALLCTGTENVGFIEFKPGENRPNLQFGSKDKILFRDGFVTKAQMGRGEGDDAGATVTIQGRTDDGEAILSLTSFPASNSFSLSLKPDGKSAVDFKCIPTVPSPPNGSMP